MSDLISRSALIEMLDKDIKMTEKFINEIGTPSEKTLKHYAELASQLNTIKSYKGIIEAQPTAYDVEKVVAELEELQNDVKNYWDDDYYKGKALAYEDAIEIVRKGGVE